VPFTNPLGFVAGILVDFFFCCHLFIVWYVIIGEDDDAVY